MHFEDTIDEVHDPVITQAGSGIKAALDPAVEPQARIGDLYNEGSHGGVSGDIVAGPAGDDGHVWLGLRVVVEGQRRVQARMPSNPECRGEHLTDMGNNRGVGTALRFSDDKQPAEELEALAYEHAEIDEPLVFHPAPATSLPVQLGH